MRGGLRHLMNKTARRIFLTLVQDNKARKRTLRHFFGKEGEDFYTPKKIINVDGVNSAEAVSALKQLQPDAILVYGTSVVADTVLRLSRDLCFNMHTGISPYYRGTSCVFWPIVNGELNMLGATIHECASQVDGGAIFEIARIAYKPGDSLHGLFGRAVVAGTEAYVKVIERYLAGKLEGVPQDLTVGREYRGADLTIGPEITARFRLGWLRMRASLKMP